MQPPSSQPTSSPRPVLVPLQLEILPQPSASHIAGMHSIECGRARILSPVRDGGGEGDPSKPKALRLPAAIAHNLSIDLDLGMHDYPDFRTERFSSWSLCNTRYVPTSLSGRIKMTMPIAALHNHVGVTGDVREGMREQTANTRTFSERAHPTAMGPCLRFIRMGVLRVIGYRQNLHALRRAGW
ncbi:hypothetical protein CGCSCA1_v014631 [Colletotrichum siamense]|nr:hypothetical protein CGCSCA1_v014631 [Colletotrichum siamense]